MIRVNLLMPRTPPHAPGVRRWRVVPPEQRAALVGLALLVSTVGLVGASWWFVGRERGAVGAQLVMAEADRARLQAAAALADRAADRVQSLERRLALLARLRAAQTTPGDMLDAIGDSLTDGLWLTELAQEDAGVEVRGRALTFSSVMAFIDRLQESGCFAEALEIVEAGTDTAAGFAVVRFVVRGVLRAAIDTPARGGA